MLTLRYRILLVLPVLVYSLEKDDACTTPNGENASCIPIASCKVLQDGLYLFNNTITQFILKSKCGSDENGSLVCCGSTNVPTFTLRPLQHKLLPDSGKCGMQTTSRIWGGEIVELNEFPWMALLGYKSLRTGQWSGFKCGGTVISKRYVLTAAHCIKTKGTSAIELEKVRLGEWRISTESDCDDEIEEGFEECAEPPVDVNVEKAIPHSNYSRKSGDNDIGLIRLESNIQFTEFIRPICLPSSQPPIFDEYTELFTSGWGSTENYSVSDIKLKLQLSLVPNEKCIEKIKDRGLISDRQLCAGGMRGKDTCSGDSGGPLMLKLAPTVGAEQWFQVGVISWGIGCGQAIPGVYTKVSKYLNWILDNMEAF